jgi:uncharacterized membrane protein
MGIHDVLQRTETLDMADKPASGVAGVVAKVLPAPVSALLRGAWLGHPVHPLLVTLPIGAWTSAVVLDCTGRRSAARQLVGVGLASVPVTVLAGLADYPDLSTAQRRTGLVHACANAAATAFMAASYVCRARGRHAAGSALSAVGLAVMGVGGALGGHLAYAQGGGVYRFQAPPFVRRPE